MPAKDSYHDTVKQALIRDGWTIGAEQLFVKFYGRHIWIDIRAERREQGRDILNRGERL